MEKNKTWDELSLDEKSDRLHRDLVFLMNHYNLDIAERDERHRQFSERLDMLEASVDGMNSRLARFGKKRAS